jgi:hypothetical protein
MSTNVQAAKKGTEAKKELNGKATEQPKKPTVLKNEKKGEVHNMDVLRQTKPRVSYSVNYDFHKHKTPLILLKRPV